ncbi:hypothetical protein FIV42_17015 [Persicimonas caeni]|uniref:Uncharacterized protein n=1 Tax=Persicimonas caeni TaxID=2292766 RepID=A0A4Y6PVV9_PERCE|nr:hypothetical protein [Persicimonas caeni]QDG52380.1 hypothetical protein FIV42_17015 [Persicimonas caeni]QED33602.1 hypothetical protein FRD00_17010 [Persicimonas caeni]
MSESKPSDNEDVELLNLRLEQSCVDNLLWRVDLPDEVDLAALGEALAGLGCREKGEASVLPVFVTFTEDEHRIMIVETTRRTQLRVHYLTPKGERVAAAEGIAELLAQACEDACA